MSDIFIDNFKINEPYYNGYKLLSYNDLNGVPPEIYISTSNRAAGKTTFFLGYSIHRFIKNNEKFCILVRTQSDIFLGNEIFSTVMNLFFPKSDIIQKNNNSKSFCELYMKSENEIEKCGYIIALNSSEKIKRYSPMFYDVKRIIFDEFQTDKYIKNEPEKLISIHTSIARGEGKMKRRVPIFLIGNLLDRFNPYYELLGISASLDISSKFVRGNGFVIEQGFNKYASEAHSTSGFGSAFSNSSQFIMNTQKKYALENDYFIDPTIRDYGIYILTLKYKSKYYSVRYIDDIDMFYISDKYDPNFKIIAACSIEDIGNGAVDAKKVDWVNRLYKKMKDDRLRFKNRTCRNAFMAIFYVSRETL